MYCQTEQPSQSCLQAQNTITAGAFAAAYSVRVAGVKMDTLLDCMHQRLIPEQFLASMAHINIPLRAALPSSVVGDTPFSQGDHYGAQAVRRAPTSSIKTGHSDFFAVLDKMGARHRSAFGVEGLRAAFSPLDTDDNTATAMPAAAQAA